ncbi:hypothetical protein Tco_0624944 [Tanacetum coccineum]|uniref:Uncharacterized protein n=1 Tax=Tanacetum coccineum TaxID=301880 RepID=A0ABQ4WFG0_9ASTR
MKNVIEQKINPIVEDLATDMDEFYRFLKEEILEDLKYFNSLKKEIESLKSQLELQRTHFSNEIDRLSKEYYYADHMNAILGVIFITSVSRPQLKRSQLEDRVLHNNSQVKKKEVQDHSRRDTPEHHNFKNAPKHMTEISSFLVNFGRNFLDLEVAFWKSNMLFLDLKGNDLLQLSVGSDIYSTPLQEKQLLLI